MLESVSWCCEREKKQEGECCTSCLFYSPIRVPTPRWIGGEFGKNVLLSTLLDWAVMLSREHGGLKEGEAFSTLNPATHVLRDVSLGLEVREVGLFWLYMDK